MSLIDSLPGMDRAKEAASLINILRGFKSHLGEIINSTTDLRQQDFSGATVSDADLGYKEKPLADILRDHPELKNGLDEYLDKNIYHGIRGYFLSLYDKTSKTINGVQGALNSGQVKGLDELVIALEKGSAKEILLPVVAFTYVVGKILLTISGYGAGIYGRRSDNYLKDIIRPMEDDFKLQASSLLSLVPLGNKVTELFHLSSIDTRVQELINEKASLYVVNSLRQQNGLEPLKEPLNVPGLVDKANEYLKSKEPMLQEYGHSFSRAYEKIMAMPGYMMEKIGYAVHRPMQQGA